MKTLNVVTSTNDTVQLADGTFIGKKEPTIKYDDLSVGINHMMKAVVSLECDGISIILFKDHIVSFLFLWKRILKEQEREEYLTKHPENALEPCKTNLVKVLTEKENIGKVQNNIGPKSSTNSQRNNGVGVLAGSSNANRRVSFMSPSAHHQRPPVTPRSSFPAQTYPAPYTYNYLTSLQSPISPSFNYPSYHGYGMPTNHGQVLPQGSPYPYPGQVLPQGSPYQPQTGRPIPTSNQLFYNRPNVTPVKEYSNLMNNTKRTREHTGGRGI